VDGESRSGEQAWELLESPSSQSHEDEKLIENGRLDSSESTKEGRQVLVLDWQCW
jgi:hypothetical protein